MTKGLTLFRIACIMAIFLLTGCGWINTSRKVIAPDGSIYTIEARGDDLISFKTPDFEILVDGRGRPGMIEQALGIMFLNLPDVTVEK